jgi:predicted lactoylglutathione lyase
MLRAMIDHISLHVKDCAASKAFYKAALAPFGYELMMEFGEVGGFGAPPKPDFWIGPTQGEIVPAHVAFAAKSREEVEAFYEAALAAGGKDNGPPGLRPNYHPGYYGAFVLDPNGHNVEAVFHGG